MKIFQISDLHLPSSPEERYGDIDTLGRCQKLVSHLSHETADLLVVTGDIAAETENRYSYRFLKQQLENLPYSWVVLPGNHDRGPLFREVFGPSARIGFDVHQGSDGARIVFFDNSGESPSHLDALEAYLKETDRAVCLFTHYPPIPVGHPSYDGKHSLLWREEFLATLQNATVPLHVFFGHIHFAFQKKMKRVHFYSVPSGTAPVIRGDHSDLPDEKGLYFREITLRGSDWKTSLKTL